MWYLSTKAATNKVATTSAVAPTSAALATLLSYEAVDQPLRFVQIPWMQINYDIRLNLIFKTHGNVGVLKKDHFQQISPWDSFKTNFTSYQMKG